MKTDFLALNDNSEREITGDNRTLLIGRCWTSAPVIRSNAQRGELENPKLQTRQSPLVVITLALMTLTLAGCGANQDPYPRVAFCGTVYLDGAPFESGFLYLEPLEKQPTQAYAVIQKGKFDVPRASGAVPGRYRVAIVRDDSFQLPEGVDPQTPEGSEIADKLSRENRTTPLHPSYNVRSKLEALIKSDGDNDLNFQLRSNPEQ